IGVMPTALPALDAPIAADRSHSIVVDVPFGVRGGLPVAGRQFPPESMVLATADGHPLGDGYASRIPSATLAGITPRPFYAAVLRLQADLRPNTPAQLSAARRSARLMRVGWVLVWVHSAAIQGFLPGLRRFLPASGFRFAYRADGVSVYRRLSGGAAVPAGPGGPGGPRGADGAGRARPAGAGGGARPAPPPPPPRGTARCRGWPARPSPPPGAPPGAGRGGFPPPAPPGPGSPPPPGARGGRRRRWSPPPRPPRPPLSPPGRAPSL